MTIVLRFTTVLFLLSTVTLTGCPKSSNPNDYPDSSIDVNLKLATTTSLDNSGLLEAILPAFTEESGIKVDVVAVGTGAALQHGRNGDVDVVLVHAPNAEKEFIEEAHGTERSYIAKNEFVIVGIETDPAGLADFDTAGEAFLHLMGSGTRFISRGDDSGTHKREMELWNSIDTQPSGEWYIEAGQGMGAILNMANELEAYTLTDIGTFYSMEHNLDLVILLRGDAALENIYSIIPVDPLDHPDIYHEGALELVEWITGDQAKELIDGFEVNGHQLFDTGPPSGPYS